MHKWDGSRAFVSQPTFEVKKYMEIGEPVYCVSAVPDSDTLLCVGCESGKFMINDIETGKSVYSAEDPDSVIAIRPSDANTIFTATESVITVHDTRAGHKPKTIFQAPSEISDLAVNGDFFAVATCNNDILTSDKRVLRKAKASGILPSVCSSLTFMDSKHIFAGYFDTTTGIWDLTTNKFAAFDPPAAQQFNPPVVHSVATNGKLVAVARQTGLYFYNSNRKCICNSMFLHEGAVQVVTFAKCFDTPFTVSGAADGSLMVFDCTKVEPLDCLNNDDEKIESITSNSRIIAVADTSENGNIGIFKPEDFLNHEEEEEAHEN